MIERIHIRNFAIIDELEIDFQPGLTVLTGETGAGKSIILQALGVSLGAPPNRLMVKTDVRQATVETVFSGARQQITVYRVMPARGRTRNFINDEPVEETSFISQTRRQADFHGQHEQQLIMDKSTHISYLDDYCGNGETVAALKNCYTTIDNTRKTLNDARLRQQHSEQRRQLLDFQLKEILAVAPKLDEDIRLGEEFKLASHREELLTAVESINRIITADEDAIQDRLFGAIRELERLVKYDAGLQDTLQLLNDASINLQEANSGLQRHAQALDHDQDRLREIEDRLLALEALKRKYGGTLARVLEYRVEIDQELSSLTGLHGQIGALEKQIRELYQEYQTLADSAHQCRVSAVERLSAAIEAEMHRLQMPGARFEIRIAQVAETDSPISVDGRLVRFLADGYDNVEFFLSANPGERTKPLAAIASGGEISRIMLAIKTVLQTSDPVETLIFDEIDTGISGTAAELVAASLARLAQTKQVICITHLPQIAARAHQHLLVEKTIKGSVTTVSAAYLSRDERITDLARLIAGSNITAADRATAQRVFEHSNG
ncbi:MAG: DNA repair protein RecN [Candidatus Neomarinimicrobiota bacterium]